MLGNVGNRLFGILKSESYKLEAITTSYDDIFSISWESFYHKGFILIIKEFNFINTYRMKK